MLFNIALQNLNSSLLNDPNCQLTYEEHKFTQKSMFNAVGTSYAGATDTMFDAVLAAIQAEYNENYHQTFSADKNNFIQAFKTWANIRESSDTCRIESTQFNGKNFDDGSYSPACLLKFAVDTGYKFTDKTDTAKYCHITNYESFELNTQLKTIQALRATLNTYTVTINSFYYDRNEDGSSAVINMNDHVANSYCILTGLIEAVQSSTNDDYIWAEIYHPQNQYTYNGEATSCEMPKSTFQTYSITMMGNDVNGQLVGNVMNHNIDGRHLFDRAYGLTLSLAPAPKQLVTPTSSNPNDKKNIGVIVGCSIAGVAVVATVIIVVIIYIHKNKSNNDSNTTNNNDECKV